MAVSLGTFYCPNSNTKISTKYMGALVDVDKIKDRNWSRYIHEWLMWYIKKYQADPLNAKQLNRTLGGCIYHLVVCFLCLLFCIFIFHLDVCVVRFYLCVCAQLRFVGSLS
jgi:hypothetical protein